MFVMFFKKHDTFWRIFLLKNKTGDNLEKYVPTIQYSIVFIFDILYFILFFNFNGWEYLVFLHQAKDNNIFIAYGTEKEQQEWLWN